MSPSSRTPPCIWAGVLCLAHLLGGASCTDEPALERGQMSVSVNLEGCACTAERAEILLVEESAQGRCVVQSGQWTPGQNPVLKSISGSDAASYHVALAVYCSEEVPVSDMGVSPDMAAPVDRECCDQLQLCMDEECSNSVQVCSSCEGAEESCKEAMTDLNLDLFDLSLENLQQVQLQVCGDETRYLQCCQWAQNCIYALEQQCQTGFTCKNCLAAADLCKITTAEGQRNLTPDQARSFYQDLCSDRADPSKQSDQEAYQTAGRECVHCSAYAPLKVSPSAQVDLIAERNAAGDCTPAEISEVQQLPACSP